MLSKKNELAPGMAIFSISSSWAENVSKSVEVIHSYYDVESGENFTPHTDEVTLRREVLGASSALADLEGGIKDLMSRKYCGIVIDNLGIRGDEHRNSVLYSIALALGYPTPTDRESLILWDVKSRQGLAQDYQATFSEKTVSAELHTDSSFYERPEEAFFLYVANAAKCGGGRSLMLSAREIADALLETPRGRDCFSTLSKAIFPFETPMAFSSSSGNQPLEITVASIFGDKPYFRFRYDLIKKGFAARPDLATAEALEAIDMLLNVIENKVKIVDHWFSDDNLIIANNHMNLHGRTKFSDQNRHLIRARISDVPVAKLGRNASLSND